MAIQSAAEFERRLYFGGYTSEERRQLITARDDAIRAEEREAVDLLIKRLDVLCDDLSGAAGSIRRGSGLAQIIRGDLLVRARASSSATQPEPAAKRNPAMTDDDERAMKERLGWRMRPDGSYFKSEG